MPPNENGESNERPIDIPIKDPVIELDGILAESSHDPEALASLDTLQGALDLLNSTSLNVLSATCSVSVCRINFQHARDSDAAEAQRDLMLKLSWDATYIMKTEPESGSSNMLVSTLYVDKRPTPPGV